MQIMDLSFLVTTSNLKICADIKSSLENSLAKIGANYEDTIAGIKDFDAVIKKLMVLELSKEIVHISEFAHKSILIPFLAKLCQALNREKNNQCSRISSKILGNNVSLICEFLCNNKNQDVNKELVSVLTAMHNLLPEHFFNLNHFPDVKLPLIVWQDVSGCNQFPNEMKMCNCPSANKFSIKLKLFDLKIKHCTTSVALQNMLTDPDSIEFIGKRATDPVKKSDICPQGLIYFGVDTSSISDNMRSKYAKENRYGASTISVMLHDITSMEESTFINLGTKIYFREHSQQRLLSVDATDEWWLLAEQKIWHNNEKINRVYNLKKLEADSSDWDVSYCHQCSAWTHPEIVFPGNLEVPLENVKILFEDYHACIVTDDGRRENCIECKIRQQGGMCRGKIGNSEECRNFNFFVNTADLAIQMFAYGYPIAQRQMLRKCQAIYNMFTWEHFEKIERYWMEECKDFEISEWKVGHYNEEEMLDGSSPTKMQKAE
ncbi:uncharacterized protein LOC118437992 isoform X1 [Folsomia candida]|uniref:uncharacterized protein LOC118437992 isoform X1 n=1 Tax=Folsomia candida TaxID=158441 RepID=UPI0016055C62|nr:uncharacterized protein LOC118437992 isoform X1 [Folsomia candida]XP_035713514.1 uncharacterized protein LOC118437992 isoform X1 [Folsomia candida]XP_035713515.1 uncharacterized protein LOC118437992 isoform X1 [Folsomia candida]